MDLLFDVYVLRFDVNEERATRGLVQVFGLTEAAARIFVRSVPRVGKRNVPTATAERYVRALHAVGAVVECRRSGATPLGDNANRVEAMSLPIPTNSNYPGASRPPHIMQDSLGIMAPLAYAPNMPQIPKAPRVPADLHAIRARKGPDSLAPHWRKTDPPPGPKSKISSGHGSHTGAANLEAAFWSPSPDGMEISSDPLAQLQSPFAVLPNSSPYSSPELAHPDDLAASGSLQPLSASPFAPSRSLRNTAKPWLANTAHQLIVACSIIAAMVIAVSSGVFDTVAARRNLAFEHAGIDAGDYEAASAFLSRPGDVFEGLPVDKLQSLVDGLARAGARGVWVTNIARSAQHATSRTLVFELPTEPDARRTIFFQHLRSIDPRSPSDRPIEDRGQTYLRLVF